MTLRYIHEATVVVDDLEAAVAFHREAFGFAELERDGNGNTAVLGAASAPSGRIRLTEADVSGGAESRAEVWDIGARLFGLYSRDLEQTSDAVRAAGGQVGPIVTYPYGAGSLSEMLAYGGHNVWWTIPLAKTGAHRPSAAYAADSTRLHSELHTVVLVVDDHDSALDFFQAGGMQTVFDGEMDGPDFETLIGMPEGARLRLSFLGGPDHLPARLELMSFTGTPTADRRDDAHGITRLTFACDDVAATRDALMGAGARALPDGGLLGPVGIVLELVHG